MKLLEAEVKLMLTEQLHGLFPLVVQSLKKELFKFRIIQMNYNYLNYQF